MTTLMYLWYGVFLVQVLMSYGTVYRLTKRGGDNGVALYGWLLALLLASIIPGLAVQLWFRYREKNMGEIYESHNRHEQDRRVHSELILLKKQIHDIQANVRACPTCNAEITKDSVFCKSCGINVQKYDEKETNARRKKIEEGGGITVEALLEDEEFARVANGMRKLYGKNAYVEELKAKAKALGFDDIDVTGVK